jgi:hypothetical protein
VNVDGVPFSFAVLPLERDSGWAMYDYTEISKNTFGSDEAEAMLYWTAYPEGAHTDRCSKLDLPLDGSMVELADAIAATAGTTLVSGPTYVTVGGRPTQRVVLTVTEDLGCDPKYFFTSEPARGGPAWWETKVNATIRVWLVDVDGTRFFIGGESRPRATTELVQELDDIVDSIRFE